MARPSQPKHADSRARRRRAAANTRPTQTKVSSDGAPRSRVLGALAIGGAVIGIALLAGVVYMILTGESPLRSDIGTTQTQTSSEARPISTLYTSDFHSLAFSPQDPDAVYFGHHNGLMISEDGGYTWQSWLNQRNWDAMGLAVSEGAFYVAGHDIFFKSADWKNWEPLRHNLPGTDIHGFAADPDNPQVLYAFVVGYGLYTSNDGGSVWQSAGAKLPQGIMALAVTAGTPKAIIAGDMQSGLLRSTDNGATWSKVAGGFAGKYATGVAAAPKTPGLLYAGSNQGLFRSNDAGATWLPLSLGVEAMGIAVSPTDGQIVLVVDAKGQVYRSEDGGASWGG